MKRWAIFGRPYRDEDRPYWDENRFYLDGDRVYRDDSSSYRDEDRPYRGENRFCWDGETNTTGANVKLTTVLEAVDSRTARAFVGAAKELIDALLIEGRRIQQTQTPGEVDYSQGELSRESAAGGWISNAELTETTRKMAEAIAAEKWVDGVVFAARVIALLA